MPGSPRLDDHVFVSEMIESAEEPNCLDYHNVTFHLVILPVSLSTLLISNSAIGFLPCEGKNKIRAESMAIITYKPNLPV